MRGVGLRRGSLDFSAALEMTRDGGLVGGDVYLPAGEGEGGVETRPLCIGEGGCMGAGSVSGGAP